MIFKCPYCDREFPDYYENKGHNRMGGYYGDQGRYNFRGARANFNRHMKACEKRATPEQKEKVRKLWEQAMERLYG